MKIFHKFVVGVDEVNVFSLLGPVVACAYLAKHKISGVRDSKLLTYKKIHELAPKLKERGLFSLACSFPKDISIVEASQLAKKRAIVAFLKKYKIPYTKTLFLIDGLLPVELAINQICIVNGDKKVYNISAASIIAKDFQLRLFEQYEKMFPGITKIQPTKKGAKMMAEYQQKYGAIFCIREKMLQKMLQKTD